MNRKKPSKRTTIGQAMTELILAVFRANGRLLTVGDVIGKDLGLSSTRWQVLGGILDRPKTVAQIARNFELTRQGVLWVVQALEKSGHVELIPNPDHRTAKLVQMTPKGSEAYDEITERQIGWVNKLSKTFDLAEVEAAETVLKALWRVLD
jgi:DNA-binding MarR family transcriptional regulator